MSKKKIGIIAGIIALLLTTGAIAYAQDDGTKNDPRAEMMESAIKEGVITQEQADNLKTYGKEFMEEKHQEMMKNILDDAIKEGDVTQSEAQEIRDWFDSRPDALEKLAPKKGKGGIRGMGGYGFMK